MAASGGPAATPDWRVQGKTVIRPYRNDLAGREPLSWPRKTGSSLRRIEERQ